jgi:hypothetical protein
MFLKKNYKSLLFPLMVIGIAVFDQVFMHFALEFTALKILFVSILHSFVVLRTNYVYTTDIYIYLSSLKLAREKNFVVKPILSQIQCNFLFFSSFISFFILTHVNELGELGNILFGVLIGSFCVLFLNSLNEVFRNYTNKADLRRVNVPASLQQRRYVISLAQLGTKAVPLCVNTVKLLGATLGLSELGVPMLTGGPNNIGPITAFVVNKKYADNDMTCPIRTRLDITAEHAYYVNEENVKEGNISENPTGKRMFSLTTPKQLFELGVGSFDK